MDGFGENEGIIMIAATNRPDILDPRYYALVVSIDKFKLAVQMLKVVRLFFMYTLKTNHLMKLST